MMGWSGGGVSPLGGGVTVVLWLALLALIAWLIRRILPGVSGETTANPIESELEVLDRQLASGEIEMHAWQDQRSAFLAARTNPCVVRAVRPDRMGLGGAPSVGAPGAKGRS